MKVLQLTAVELAERLRDGSGPVVLDVRETPELEIARFPGVLHIPLGELPRAIESLSPEREYVLLCHHGIRSAQAAAWMLDRGFARVANLVGGIDAWSREVDPTIERY